MSAPLVKIRTWNERRALINTNTDVIIAPNKFQFIQFEFERLPESRVDPEDETMITDDDDLIVEDKVNNTNGESDVSSSSVKNSSEFELDESTEKDVNTNDESPNARTGFNVDDYTRQGLIEQDEDEEKRKRIFNDNNLFTIAQIGRKKSPIEIRNCYNFGVSFTRKPKMFTVDGATITSSDDDHEREINGERHRPSSLKSNWFLRKMKTENEIKLEVIDETENLPSNIERDNLIEELQVSNTQLPKLDPPVDKDHKSIIEAPPKTYKTTLDIKKRISWRSLLDSKTHRLPSSFLDSKPTSSTKFELDLERYKPTTTTPKYREIGIDIGDLEKNLPKGWKDDVKEKNQPTTAEKQILNNQTASNLKPGPINEDNYTTNKLQDPNVFIESSSPSSCPSNIRDNRISTVSLDAAVVGPQYNNDEKDPRTMSHHQGHFVVVAVDFGTTFSGYAFSFTRDPENIHMMRKWEGGDPGVTNQKTPTCLLLKPDGQFHSFGYMARDHYHDLDAQEAKLWFYFDKFKMTLHHKMNLNRDTQIEATNGKSKPALTIFALALRYFKDHALQELSDQSATKILNEDIRWVITVPAIWRQPAKQFMRQAAYEAGIASPEYPDQLLIALEPEAASIYCRKLRMNQLVPETLQQNRLSIFPEKDEPIKENTNPAINDGKQGTRYIVVDCGGGTVDITVHEMTDKIGNLKELHKATGGPFGSVGVDIEFENLIKEIFGSDFIEQFKTKRPAGYVELMVAFEARKRSTSLLKTNPLNISLPFSFIDYYRKCKGSSVESAIRKYGNKNIRWSLQGMLRFDPEVMCQLFRPVIKGILTHINAVLSNFESHSIQYLFLVGGFAESQILQQEIRNAFSSQLRVMIPQGVSLAILRGAVLYGLDPTVVCVRRSRLTYGVGVLNRFIRNKHPVEKLIVRDGQEWCADVFDKFVLTDQSVGLGDTILRSYTPANSTQKKITLHIYCTENDQAQFVTDPGVRKCGTLHLILEETENVSPKRREIQTRMIFGDTEIKVSALDVATHKSIQAEIDFLNL